MTFCLPECEVVHIVFNSLLLDVLLYNMPARSFTHCCYIVSVGPEFSTPKIFLYFWKLEEDLFCSNAFVESHELSDGILGMK